MRAPGFLIGAGILVGLLTLAEPSSAQGGGMPPIPDKQEIERRIREAFPKVLEQSPEETLEIAGLVKIVYKKVPCNPSKIAKMLGQDIAGRDLPPGVDIDQYIGPFLPQITALLNENLGDVGSFEALQILKVKSKRIPVGEHRFGLVFEGERPVALRVFSPEPPEGEERPLPKPVDIRLKTKSVDLQEELQIELKEPKKQKPGKEKFDIQFAFLRFMAKSKTAPQVAGD